MPSGNPDCKLTISLEFPPEMSPTEPVTAEGFAVPMRGFPVLLLLFLASGCAALIYEVVWFELLELIIGSSAVSMGLLLATFMGGMCAGSLLLPRVVSPLRHPLKVYALLELGIGCFGLLILWALPPAGRFYASAGGSGILGLILRGLLSVAFLLPPTLLMGATLPAVARSVESSRRGMARLGYFYGGNTLGAVCGSLLSGFYLLRVHDVTVATAAAAGLNLLVAAAAWGLAAANPDRGEISQVFAPTEPVVRGSYTILLAIAFSGMTALMAEVVWTRLLSLLLGGTVYTFALILAAFLAGIGMGSAAGSAISRTKSDPRFVFGLCQLLLLAGMAWAVYAITILLPYRAPLPQILSRPEMRFLADIAKCLIAVFPSACLWGASFPLALAGLVARRGDPGRLAGAVYAANTAGAILGALAASLWVFSHVGTQGAQRIMTGITVAGALLVWLPSAFDRGRAAGARLGSAAGSVVALGLATWFYVLAAPVPGPLVAYGRYAARFSETFGEVIYVGEGLSSSMAVSLMPDGVLNYHNAGKIQASSEPRDMRLQRMLGHLTTLVPESPRSVMVIGCGAGVTAGSVSIDPAVDRVTIVEIERLVPQVVSTYFGQHNFNVVRNPKVHVEIDDARHFALTTHEKFDAITSDPFDPWVKGAATLYTREFFEILKQRLNPGGVVTVFVQLYQSNLDAVKSEFATFFEAFPEGTVWCNAEEGEGYDLVLLGQAGPKTIDLLRIEQRLRRPDYAPVVLSLGEIGIHSAVDLFSTFGGSGSDFTLWLRDAQVNLDGNLRLQYLAGLGLDLQKQDDIYREMIRFRRFPPNLFAGPKGYIEALKLKIALAR